MSKAKVVILLLFLFFISLVFALEWKLIIEAVDKAYKIVGLKTPSYILTIIEKESGFGENLGRNLGSKEKNLKACVKYCEVLRNRPEPAEGTECYSFEARIKWCNNQYSALEKITYNLGLDINKVPFSPDFGIGYTQFQPTTWLQYKELRNKNPWNLEDSLYAAALKLKYDGIHENEWKAVWFYNHNEDYINDYLGKRQEWDQILDDTIFVYDCPYNNFSCALSIIKTNYPECTENDWSIKKKKECIKTKVAFQKEKKLAQKENEYLSLSYKLGFRNLEIKESTIPTFSPNQSANTQSVQGVLSLPRSVPKVLLRDPNQSDIYKNKPQEEKVVEIRRPNYIEEREVVIKRRDVDVTEIRAPLSQRKLDKEDQSKKEINKPEKRTFSDLTQTIRTDEKLTQNKETSNSFSQSLSQSSSNQSQTITFTGGEPIKPKDICDEYSKKFNYPKIIINEIQFETAADTKDEFIELYNPNNEEVDLTCWRLEKYTADKRGSQRGSNADNMDKQPITLIPSSKFQGKIKPYGYFLITSSSTKEKYQGDLAYAESYSISKNNVIILRKPNGEISDLVGYGDDKEKIYQYENSPFIFENNVRKVCNQSAQSVSSPNQSANNQSEESALSPNQSECIYKSIQRKNFQDTDDNSKDFWLHKPSPKNSTFIEIPRQDFIDLTNITIQNFNVFVTSSDDGYFLNISFNEPNPEAEPLARFGASNYSYELLISTSTADERGFNADKRGYTLNDFGITSTLPWPKFDGSTTSLSFEITKCPTTSTIYYFALFIKDNLDEENKSKLATSSVTLPEDLCNQNDFFGLNTDLSDINATSSGKILFSEIYIKEGTSTGEFIELYNPNEFDVDLTGWEIRRINRNGKEQTIIPSSKFKGVIPSFSYFLLVNANTSSPYQSELGTGQAGTINPDFVYPKSYDLAKDNALILIDKEGKIIDQVCWGNVPNLQNCALNPIQSTESALSPNQSALSLQRKKTATSTSETIMNQNLGNAYSTNNPANDFLYAQINPENSSIKRPTIKEIQDFKVKLGQPIITYIDPNNYGTDSLYGLSYELKFSWFSPILYDKNNLQYQIKVATETISTIEFKPLDREETIFNLYEFYLKTNNILQGELTFILNLVDENQNILQSASTTLNLNLPQRYGRLEIPKKDVEYLNQNIDGRLFLTDIKFKPIFDSEAKYIKMFQTAYHSQDIITNQPLYLYLENDGNLIATTTMKMITMETPSNSIIMWCQGKYTYLVELDPPLHLEKDKTYIIRTPNPSLRFQESCMYSIISSEGHMF